MSDTLRDLLGRALEAFERHAEEEALGRLLEAWRHARDSHIAALVERLSERLTRGLSPLDCEPGSSTMLEHRPLDLPRLLVTVQEGADRGFPGSLRKSLRAFREWPADPRFTPVLLDISRMPVAGDLGVPDVLCGLLEEVRDPRTLEPLREVRAGLPPGSELSTRLEAVIQRLLARPGLPLDEEASRLCEELEEALFERGAAEVRSAPIRESLLARVYEDPEDLEARMVLADHLLEQGDPLGELITLQCASQPDEARIEELLAAHRLRWEAPLGPSIVRGGTRFERGFPRAVQMNPWWREPLPEAAPGWATVQEIDWARAMLPDMAAWLAHPHLRNVRVLWHVEAELARGLGERGLGVRQLGVMGPVVDNAPELFTRLDGLPHLTRLLVEDSDPEDVRLCVKSRLASRLERFEARGTVGWALVLMLRKDLPVLAKLLGEEGVRPLARAIQHAAGFGIRKLHIRVECRLTAPDRKLLGAAASVYERVEWS
ncbi:TIGR02996 domain-containing protein [Pyxidicoccus caerfyrddinensis]|uniref:TIGR02996 domain-containing protein n=1 Tax=Pyxidicoccus caerfyrddinensis TaxID=2709663 RepID=UPI0013DD7707|nr:TIGR02996 domain-containing protein [Pyxidicoccus caerfyrddinensis]